MFKPTVIIDFDGVIHSYVSGWQGAGVIPDPPVAGIGDAIANMRKKYRVVVVSSRCYRPGGIDAIRAITFDGDAAGLQAKIDGFRPWTRYRQAKK